MTARFSPRGAYTALVTPFHPDGSIDEATFDELVRFQIDQGIDGLVPCGTTGESPTLEWEEHDAIVERTAKINAGARPILAGTGSNNTHEAIEATRNAKDCGADAVLLVDCYYNGPSSLELREEYLGRRVACMHCGGEFTARDASDAKSAQSPMPGSLLDRAERLLALTSRQLSRRAALASQ